MKPVYTTIFILLFTITFTVFPAKAQDSLIYCSPQETGMDSVFLYRTIDSILNTSIELKAFPGCQILIAKDGKIVMNKSYGYHTYSYLIPVENDHVYDLSSVSKTLGASLAIMKLVDDHSISLDAPFSDYWKPFKQKDKKDITFRELLAHQSGLPAFLPFHRMYCPNGKPQKNVFSYVKDKKYDTEVCNNMYANKKQRKEIYKAIANSPLKEKTYRYSDLPFLIFPEVVGKLTSHTFDCYLQENFYTPLGADNLLFNPNKHLPMQKIVPTENDEYFRYTTVHGYVHDEAAAMLGGVSGNAGLFGNATDIAKVLQMLLWKGEYGGKRYLSEEVIEEFTRCQYPENKNRRGLGFDKPLLGNDTLCLAKAYPAPAASYESYGHSGFTGTFFWVDPVNQTIYVLLTNRIFPTRNNKLLGKNNVRCTIQQVIYDAIDRFNSTVNIHLENSITP
ncbi:serine hydrolase [Porphyromonadaceae bacterium OttesenSCG-928-L07]|nr:serine hydrolase [Porphyromonadaceae bacterium OttesenSCG-928-L07]MDL2252102.1 serine hydrolase [Odoribacter sp. OttesenSCG-928-J03]MDL2330964.1 serine hydrolase [Odoribacter sp. OttesenSCG-928-A06]